MPPADSPLWIKAAAEKVRALADAKQIAPVALALAWLLHHPAGIVPITGASTVEHIVENCTADRAVLSNEEWYDLLAAVADVNARSM
jgi:aryl-alcohol dehydrogenase-like predicted oxidoreductase